MRAHRHGLPAALALLLLGGVASAGTVLPTVIPAGPPYSLAAGSTYVLRGDTTTFVPAGARLVCAAGVNVQAQPGAQLVVQGVLTANGTATAPVTFTATAAGRSRGSWQGLDFQTTASSASVLSYTRVKFAGRSPQSAAIACSGGTTVFPAPRLTNCEVSESGGDGLRSTGGAPRVVGCSFHHNNGFAIQCQAGGYVSFSAPLSKASQNGDNSITLDPVGHALLNEQVWRPGGLAYHVLGTVSVQTGGKLTLSPGLTLLMGNQANLVADQGPIVAEGTAAHPIVIRGLDSTRQAWGGIFVYAKGAGTTFRYCRISAGGRNNEAHLTANGARAAGVILDNTEISGGSGTGLYLWDSVVQVTKSKVVLHDSWGIVASGQTKLTVTGSDLSQNARFSVSQAAGARPPASIGDLATAAAASGLYLYDASVTLSGCTVSRNGGWGIVAGGNTQLKVDSTQVTQNSQDGVYNGSTGPVNFTAATAALGNTFLNNGGFEFANAASRAVSAQNCYWGTSSEAQIKQRIFDAADNTAVGKVTYKPFLSAAPHAPVAANAPLAITSATAAPTRGAVQVTYALSTAASVQAEVLNLAGRPVRTLTSHAAAAAGLNTLLWDGSNNSGLAAPSGTYLIRLRATTPDGQLAQTIVTVSTRG